MAKPAFLVQNVILTIVLVVFARNKQAELHHLPQQPQQLIKQLPVQQLINLQQQHRRFKLAARDQYQVPAAFAQARADRLIIADIVAIMFIRHQLLAAVEQHPHLTQAEQQQQLILARLTLLQLTPVEQLIQLQLTQAVEQKAMVQHAPLIMNAVQTFAQEAFAPLRVRDIQVQHIQLTLVELILLTHRLQQYALQEPHGIAIRTAIAKI